MGSSLGSTSSFCADYNSVEQQTYKPLYLMPKALYRLAIRWLERLARPHNLRQSENIHAHSAGAFQNPRTFFNCRPRGQNIVEQQNP